MNWINYDDVLAQLAEAQLVIDSSRLTFDARIQRWKVSGEDNEKRGWTRLKEWTSKAGNTYIVGCYGVWRGPNDGYTKIELPKRDDNRPVLSDDDIAAIREAQKEAARKLAAERKLEAKTAGQWAAIVWSRCVPCTEHEYTTRKQIQPHGLRVLESIEGITLPNIDDSNWYRLTKAIGALVVPMHDAHGNVCGIQFIYPRGHERAKKIERDKEFWPAGMAMGGTFGLIGHVSRTGVLLLAEGYATAASLHEASGQAVAYAFSANNLGKAGKLLRKVYPRLRLLLCADDDYVQKCLACKKYTPVAVPICQHCGKPHQKSNDGIAYAAKATAELEHAAWIKPDFLDSDGNDPRNGRKLTDYNDLAVLTGVPLILANQINAKLDELKWRDPATVRGGEQNPGGGDGGTDDPDDARRRAVSVMSLDDAVARFIPLDDGTGKFVFDTWANKIVLRDQMITLLPAGMRGDDVKRHPVYIERGAYYIDQVGFDPAGTDRHVKLNTWLGWPRKPRQGCCDALLRLLHYLCSGDPKGDEVMRWVLCWMAYPLQHPGAKMSSAIIMHGPQGTGKSTVFEVLAKIYGKGDPYINYSVWLDQKALQDNSNADWENKLFVLAEEVVNGSDKWQLKNELKAVVTSETIRIRKLYHDGFPVRNRCNLVFLSNENQPLPLDNDDRRHLVIWTPPILGEDEYDDVFVEIENGGVEAFYHYLLTLDLSGFHPNKRPPMTEAKQSLIALSSPSETRFILDLVGGELGLPICPALAMDVYAAYLKWCRVNGESRPRPSNQFIGAVARMPGWEKVKARIYKSTSYVGETSPKSLLIPPPQVLQAAKRERPPGEALQKWYTDGAFDFANAMKSEESHWSAAA